MFKSNIEIREFAINKAVELLGPGVPIKDVVEKAKEIETYVKGEAELPEVQDEERLMAMIMETLGTVAGQAISGLCNPEPKVYEPAPEVLATTDKKK